MLGQTPTKELRTEPVAGFYDEGVEVFLKGEEGSNIYYTLDGSVPTTSSRKFDDPIRVKRTQTICYRSFSETDTSRVYSSTYVIDEPSTIPVIAISVKKSLLFDEESGIFEKGPNAESTHPYRGANFWKDKEIPIQFEFIEPDGTTIDQGAGLKIFGGNSRGFDQKSVAIAFRSEYGKKKFKHKVFPSKDISSFRHLVIRNAGSDNGKAHCRDVFINSLVANENVDLQAFRPCHVYINSRYWGLYFLREKVNRDFFQANYANVDKDSLDLIEHRKQVRNGSYDKYEELLDYIRKNDLAKDEHYAHVKTLMDVNNFLTLQLIQIYIDNQDAGGNIKFWRPHGQDKKFRWVLFDMDWGFSLYYAKAYRNTSLHFHTAPNGPEWPNPPWSTFLLRNLLKNEEFKADFIQKMSELMAHNFSSENAQASLDEIEQMLDPEMDRQFRRWKQSRRNWEKELDIMRRFARKRPDYMKKELEAFFDIEGQEDFIFASAEGGTFKLNGSIIQGDSVVKKYYTNISLGLEAIPDPGYAFVQWEGVGSVNADTTTLRVIPSDITEAVRPVFQKVEDEASGLVISEVHFSNPGNAWFEIYNPLEEIVDLKGYRVLLNRKPIHKFGRQEIHPGTFYLIENAGVLNKEESANAEQIDFQLSPGPVKIELLDSRGITIYRTLFSDLGDYQLKQGFLEGANPEAWEVVTDGGSPGSRGRQPILSGLGGSMPFILIGAILILIIAFLFKDRKLLSKAFQS